MHDTMVQPSMTHGDTYDGARRGRSPGPSRNSRAGRGSRTGRTGSTCCVPPHRTPRHPRPRRPHRRRRRWPWTCTSRPCRRSPPPCTRPPPPSSSPSPPAWPAWRSGQIVVGPMSDRWGRRRPLLAGLVVYVVATALCALAPTVELLVAFRLAQGLAGAAGIVIARAVVRDLYDGVAMARFFSTLMLISGVAPIVAPLIGGQILRVTDWRGVFVVLTAVGIALTVLVVGAGCPRPCRRPSRHAGGVGEALRSMRALLADRAFTGYLLTGGFAFAALFAYISASPVRHPGDLRRLPADVQPAVRRQLRRPGARRPDQRQGPGRPGQPGQGARHRPALVIALAATALLLMSSGVFGEVGLAPGRRRALRPDVRDGRDHAQHPGPRPDAHRALRRLRVRAAGHLVLPHRRDRLPAGRVSRARTRPCRWPSSNWPAALVAVACFMGMCRPWNRRRGRGQRERRRGERTAERTETAPRHAGTGRTRPRGTAPSRPRGPRRSPTGRAPLGAGRRPGRRARPGDRRGGGGGLGRALRGLRPRGATPAWSSRRDARVPDDRRHPLRPGLPHQAVHGRRRRPADRARHAGHRRAGAGRTCPTSGRRRTRHHRTAAAHPHLRPAPRTAAVRLRRDRGDRLALLRAEAAPGPAVPGTDTSTPT